MARPNETTAPLFAGYVALADAKRLEVPDDWGISVGAAMKQQLALLRLHLWCTGAISVLFASLLKRLRKAVFDATQSEDLSLGQIPGIMVVVDDQIAQWREGWFGLVEATRYLSALIPQGTLGVLVDAAFSQPVHLVQEQKLGFGFPSWDPDLTNPDGSKGGYSPVFVDYAPVVAAAAKRVESLITGMGGLRYSDGKNLSDRIWAIPNVVRRNVLYGLRDAANEGESAYKAARGFERWLQYGEGCPRWTSTRLGLTKGEIAAGDRRGLYQGNPCEMKGISYNALRLLRNEIQIAHHAATDQVLGAVPWIKEEQIVLSPDHPDIGCECETIVDGGPKGNGTYKKGEIALPIHVQCLCFKVPVLQDKADFVRDLRGWMNGTQAWPEMDEFERWFGSRRTAPPYDPQTEEEKEALAAATESGEGTRDLEAVADVLAHGSADDIEFLVLSLIEGDMTAEAAFDFAIELGL